MHMLDQHFVIFIQMTIYTNKIFKIYILKLSRLWNEWNILFFNKMPGAPQFDNERDYFNYISMMAPYWAGR